MDTNNTQPVYILPEGSRRETGLTAQKMNILAAKIVAETVRTTLGPKGMDKMLVDSLGDVIVTNDGVTILKEMNVEHPSAKMIIEIAKTQEDEVGDGTTTAVVIAGELLKKAEELIEMNIHPSVVAKGYRMASEKAIEYLNEIAININLDDDEMLEKIAITAMTGKGAEVAKEKLARLAVKAVKLITDEHEGRLEINKDDVKIQQKVGSSIDDSELIKGVLIDKERVSASMPQAVDNAKVALINAPIEIKDTEIDAKIQITDPAQMQAFIDMEEKMLQQLTSKIINTGANVVFCQKGIDDVAQHYLSKAGIYAVRRVKKSDMEALSKATNAKIVTNISELTEKDLGYAGRVEEKKVADEAMTFVTGCKNPHAVTILIRGGTEHVAGEVKRAMEDAIGDIIAALKSGKILAGAGASEVELWRFISNYAQSLSGREQLAVNAFADAMEVIPRTLAENAGIDPIDAIAEIKAEHKAGNKWAGIDVISGKTIDAYKHGILEPLKIKTQAISSASEVSIMILRIDDVIMAGTDDKKEPQPPGDMM